MLWFCVMVLVFRISLVFCDSDTQLTSEEIQDEEPIEQLLPGLYPTFREVPKTDFSCLGKLNWNYYADLETGCQVFHICETQYSKLSFLCPVGSVFNQRHLVCDWWYNVECQDSPALYPENNLIEDEPIFLEGSDLNLASSGGNVDPSKETKEESTSNTPEVKKKEKHTSRRN